MSKAPQGNTSIADPNQSVLDALLMACITNPDPSFTIPRQKRKNPISRENVNVIKLGNPWFLIRNEQDDDDSIIKEVNIRIISFLTSDDPNTILLATNIGICKVPLLDKIKSLEDHYIYPANIWNAIETKNLIISCAQQDNAILFLTKLKEMHLIINEDIPLIYQTSHDHPEDPGDAVKCFLYELHTEKHKSEENLELGICLCFEKDNSVSLLKYQAESNSLKLTCNLKDAHFASKHGNQLISINQKGGYIISASKKEAVLKICSLSRMDKSAIFTRKIKKKKEDMDDDDANEVNKNRKKDLRMFISSEEEYLAIAQGNELAVFSIESLGLSDVQGDNEAQGQAIEPVWILNLGSKIEISGVAFSNENQFIALRLPGCINVYHFPTKLLLTKLKLVNCVGSVGTLSFKANDELYFDAENQVYKFSIFKKPEFEQSLTGFTDRVLGVEHFVTSDEVAWIAAHDNSRVQLFNRKKHEEHFKKVENFLVKYDKKDDKDKEKDKDKTIIEKIKLVPSNEKNDGLSLYIFTNKGDIDIFNLKNISETKLSRPEIDKNKEVIAVDMFEDIIVEVCRDKTTGFIYLKALIQNPQTQTLSLIGDKDYYPIFKCTMETIKSVFINITKIKSLAPSKPDKIMIFVGTKHIIGLYKINPWNKTKWKGGAPEEFDLDIFAVGDDDDASINQESDDDENQSMEIKKEQKRRYIQTKGIIRAVTSTSEFLVVGDNENNIEIFCIHTRTMISRLLNYHKKLIFDLKAFENRYIVSCSSDCSIKVFDLKFMEIVWKFKDHHSKTIRTAIMVRDGSRRYIVSGSTDKTCKISHIEYFQEAGESPYISMTSRNIPWNLVHDVYLKKYILGGITDKEKAQELLTMTQAGGDSGNDKQTADSTRIWPYGFTLLHLLAIQSPAVLGNMDLDYSKYKAPYLFDSFDKTPLHYLLEDYSKRKFNKAINKLVNYTLDWVEDDTLFPFSQRMKVLESLSSLLIHPKIKILSRLESSIAVRLLESFIQIPESKENRIDPTFYGVLADEIVICPTLRPYLNDSDRFNFLKKEKKKANKHKTLQENEDNFDQKNSTIRVSVGFLKLNYGLNSSDMKNFVTTFQGINDQAFFETKIVSVIIARLWNFHKYYHFALCIIYSVMMILYSVMVATGIDLSGGVVERNLGLDIAIIVLDAVLLVNEIFIQFRDDSKGYFKDVWNFIEFIYYWLLLSAMIYHLQASSMDDLVLAWLFGMSLFLGYLRWLSYFRLFEISRGFITVVMSVIKNMWSFGILLSFMFIGFGLIFNIFTTDSATELRMNFMSGFLSLYGPQIPEESSQSEKIVYSIAAIVLTTILSNLLVTIMSKAHEALFENKTLTDSKEKLDLILESMVYHHTRLLPKCLGKCRNRSSKKNAYKGQIYNTKPKKGCCSKKKKREAFIKEPSYLIIAENDQLK